MDIQHRFDDTKRKLPLSFELYPDAGYQTIDRDDQKWCQLYNFLSGRVNNTLRNFSRRLVKNQLATF